MRLCAVYDSIILPGIKYNCILNLKLTETQKQCLASLDRRAANILGKNVTSIENLMKLHALKLVKKCLDGKVCELFRDYFTLHHHEKLTRNNTHLLKIPRVKLEISKCGFYWMGVKLFNSLPLEIRKIESFSQFGCLVRNFLV